MKSIEKTLDILEAILERGGEAGLSELAEMTGLHQSAVRRFIAALVKRGYLFQKKRGGNYSFGMKFLKFNDIANAWNVIKENALPFMKKLSDSTSETITLVMLDQANLFDIAMVSAEHTIRVAPVRGYGLPFHCTAAGKVFLAFLQDDKIDPIINSGRLRAYTDTTITDKAKLEAEIEIVRREGVAYDNEEYERGLRATAAPIWGENGNIIASVDMLAATSRVDEAGIRKLAPKVKACALKISRSMGYKGR